MDDFLNLLNQVWTSGFLGISMSQVLVTIAILIVSLILRGVFANLGVNTLKRFTSKTKTDLDDILLDSLKRPLGFIPITIGFYLITIYLPLEGIIDLVATNVVKALIVYTIFSALSNFVSPLFSVLSNNTWLTQAMSVWLERSTRVLVWIVGLAIILDIFGIEIGPLIAGLGLFSVAIALGAQDLFKNLISGMLIIGENRFQPGHRIEVPGQFHGIVESIGFRSTTVRLFDTSPMIIPNKDLSDISVINHGLNKYRRIRWMINLIYSSSAEEISKICKEIEDFINDENQGFSINPSQDSFAKAVEFGASSIDLEILCYTNRDSYTEYSEVKQNLLLKIKSIVIKNNSDFAFPSRSIYFENNLEK